MHILENALEIERLALVALQLIDQKPGNGEDLEKEFQLALPKAYRLLQFTKEFLDKKEEERGAYWRTPEGPLAVAALELHICQDVPPRPGGRVLRRCVRVGSSFDKIEALPPRIRSEDRAPIGRSSTTRIAPERISARLVNRHRLDRHTSRDLRCRLESARRRRSFSEASSP